MISFSLAVRFLIFVYKVLTDGERCREIINSLNYATQAADKLPHDSAESQVVYGNKYRFNMIVFNVVIFWWIVKKYMFYGEVAVFVIFLKSRHFVFVSKRWWPHLFSTISNCIILLKSVDFCLLVSNLLRKISKFHSLCWNYFLKKRCKSNFHSAKIIRFSGNSSSENHRRKKV